MLKSSGELFCFNLNLWLFDLRMGETKNPNFFDFGIYGSVPEPQNQLFLTLETPGHLDKSRKNLEHAQAYYFYKSQKIGNPQL